MAKTQLATKSPVTIIAPSALTAGQVLLVGVVVGVVGAAAASGALASMDIEGKFTCPKATGIAWTFGIVLYWDNTAGNFTTTASGNTKVGFAGAIAASGDTTGPVVFTGQV